VALTGRGRRGRKNDFPRGGLRGLRSYTEVYETKMPRVRARIDAICRVPECKTTCRYALPGNSREFCLAHKTNAMENVVDPQCENTECKKINPHFNLPNEKKGRFCGEHALDGMIDINVKRCEFVGCMVQARYNIPSQKRKGRFCQEHIPEGEIMINVLTKKCAHPDGCTTRPTYNYPGEEQAIYCPKHALKDMENIKCKRCEEKDCQTRATFNLPDEVEGKFCRKHKKAGMKIVNVKTCAHENCDTMNPKFNLPGQISGLFCSKHSDKKTMINVCDPLCQRIGCNTRACYAKEGDKKPLFCAVHPEPDMVNIIINRCKLCPVAATRKVYEGYCMRCFMYTFPERNVCRNYKTKERSVADFIRAKYPNYDIAFDKRIMDGCSRRRPDMYLDMGEYIIVVETDENQHINYDCSCENKRMMELFQDGGSRPMALIRFNPDQYYNRKGKSVPSCWHINNKQGLCTIKPAKQKEWAARLNGLKNAMDDVINNRVERKEIEIIHLFYDENL